MSVVEFCSEGVKVSSDECSVVVEKEDRLIAIFCQEILANDSNIIVGCKESTGKMHFYSVETISKAWTEFKGWVLIKTGLDVEEHRPLWAN